MERELWDFMFDNYGLTLTIDEIREIINVVTPKL